MERHFVLSEEITPALLERFVSFFESTGSDKIIVFLDTEGGCNSSTYSIIEIINKNKHRVKIVITGEISSNGFYLAVLADVPVEFLESFTYALIHKIYFKTTSTELNAPSSPDNVLYSAVSVLNKKYEDMLKPVLLPQDYLDFCNNKNVVVYGDYAKKIVYGVKNILFGGDKPRNKKKARGTSKGSNK